MYKNEIAMEALGHFWRRIDEVIDDVLLEAGEMCVGENKIECVGAMLEGESDFDCFICASQEAPATRRSTSLCKLPGSWAHLSEMRVQLQEIIRNHPSRSTSTHIRPRRKYVNRAYWLPQGKETVIIDVSVPTSHIREYGLCGKEATDPAMSSLARFNKNETQLYDVRLVLFPKFEEIDEAPAATLN